MKLVTTVEYVDGLNAEINKLIAALLDARDHIRGLTGSTNPKVEAALNNTSALTATKEEG